MKIYVAGAPRRGDPLGWFGSRYLRQIREIFGSATIFYPPSHVSESAELVGQEVLGKIGESSAGITFLSLKSSGPLIEAGMLAAMGKPQVVVASKNVQGSHMLQGLPLLVGIASYGHDMAIGVLLRKLRERVGS